MKLEPEYQKCFLNNQRLNFLQGNATMVGMLGVMRLGQMLIWKRMVAIAHNVLRLGGRFNAAKPLL